MRIDLHITTLGLLLALLALPDAAGARSRVATPKSAQFAKVWDKQNFSHRLFDSLLRRHVKRGRVDYAALRKHSQPLLREYLFRVANTDPAKLSGGRAARLAFWINAHNALVIRTVLERLPQGKGVRRKRSRAAPRGLRGAYAYQVGRRWYTPLEILTKELRPRHADPRVHFVLMRPLGDGPRLWRRAFTARKVSRWLSIATRRYLRHPRRGVRLDRQARTIVLPLLFKRFRKDFEAKPGKGVLAFVATYLKTPADQTFLRQNLTRLTVRYHKAEPPRATTR